MVGDGGGRKCESLVKLMERGRERERWGVKGWGKGREREEVEEQKKSKKFKNRLKRDLINF